MTSSRICAHAAVVFATVVAVALTGSTAASAAPAPISAVDAAQLAPAFAEARQAGIPEAAVRSAVGRCRAQGAKFCAWSGEFYTGSMRAWSASVSGGGCFNLYHWGWGSRVRSVLNLTGRAWRVNDYRCWHEYRGPHVSVDSGGSAYAMGSLQNSWGRSTVSSFDPGW